MNGHILIAGNCIRSTPKGACRYISENMLLSLFLYDNLRWEEGDTSFQREILHAYQVTELSKKIANERHQETQTDCIQPHYIRQSTSLSCKYIQTVIVLYSCWQAPYIVPSHRLLELHFHMIQSSRPRTAGVVDRFIDSMAGSDSQTQRVRAGFRQCSSKSLWRRRPLWERIVQRNFIGSRNSLIKTL
jgi:hypothetical protein